MVLFATPVAPRTPRTVQAIEPEPSSRHTQASGRPWFGIAGGDGSSPQAFQQPIEEHVADIALIHASWLNQIELYFSIIQRKAFAPNDFDSLDALAERLLRFGDHYRQIAEPFDWTFTRADLDRLLARLETHERELALAA